MGTKLLIGADLVPTKSNTGLFAAGDVLRLVGEELLSRLRAADFIAMNLEVPLTDRAAPIRKCGPCLMASPETAEGLREIDPYFFTLANNHILDQGAEGLRSTMKALREKGIAFAGAGENLEEASRPYLTRIGSCRVGFYCCAEHEFSIAGENSPGANPYDPLESFDHVRRLKADCDYCIVLYHGGKECYRYPSPMLQRVFRKFAECGADLVIAQHSHCVGCMERYQGSTLVYGQGNFLFDGSNSEYWKSSLLLQLDLNSKELEYIPLVKKGELVREASGKEREEILSGFLARSEEIKSPDFVEDRYARFAREMDKEYYRRFAGKSGKSFLTRALDKMTHYGFIRSRFPDECRAVIENVLDCEAHRELAARAMKD